MPSVAQVLSITVLLLSGCSGAPPPAAATPAPANTAASPPPDGSSESGGITKEDAQFLADHCKPLADAMIAAKKQSKDGSDAAVLAAMSTAPAGMPEPDFRRCREILPRAVAAYVAASKEAEAKANVRAIARSMVAAYEREEMAPGPGMHIEHRLCPAAPPTPAAIGSLADKVHPTTDADWSGPGWSCLKFSAVGMPTRFQYEVVVDAGSFRVLARALSTDKTGLIEFETGGAVKDGMLTLWSDVARTEHPR